MTASSIDMASTLYAIDAAERRYLVRLCAWLAGDADVAEDLAQETLLEAWRNAHKLRDPSGRVPWLAAIARHVCLRWRRSQVRLGRRQVPLRDDSELHVAASMHHYTADRAVDHDLERAELAAVLHRALALLDAETRRLLVARYMHEAAHADLAAAAGLSEAAVRLKLHRGRQALRQVLQTTLHAAAAPFGIEPATGDDWETTQIWCPLCGEQRLRCYFLRSSGVFVLRCPACCPNYRSASGPNLARFESVALFHGISGVKPALSRLMRHGDAYFQRALRQRVAPCLGCGRPLPLQLDPPSYRVAPASPFGAYGVYTSCAACGCSTDICLKGIALWTPGGRQFWRQHGRIRSLPEREIVAAGQPAMLVSYRSLQDDASWDVLFARDTYQLIGAHVATRPVVVTAGQRTRAQP